MIKLKPLALAASILLLPAVAQPAAPPELGSFPDIDWSTMPPIKLDVGKLEIVHQYVPTRDPPHIDAIVPRRLDDAADHWAQQRLVPATPQGYARLVITDASIVEVPQQTQPGAAPTAAPPPVRFDAHIAVRLDIYGADNHHGSVTAEAAATRSLTNDVAGQDIARMQYMLVADALRSLNGVFDNTIHAQLSADIVP